MADRVEFGVHHYDADKREMHFACMACRGVHKWHISKAQFFAMEPDNRFTWALTLPDCPGCAKKNPGKPTHHHLNCNLPEDHPHHHSKGPDTHGAHIEAMLNHIRGT